MVGNVEPLLEERPRSAPSSWLYQALGGACCPDLETTSGAMSDVFYNSNSGLVTLEMGCKESEGYSL